MPVLCIEPFRLPNWEDAVDRDRPMGCWFRTDATAATARFTGCQSRGFAEYFATNVLRYKAIAFRTSKLVYFNNEQPKIRLSWGIGRLHIVRR